MRQIKKHYPILRLYKDDLIRIVNILIDKNEIFKFENIRIQIDKHITEIPEPDLMDINKPGNSCDEIEKIRERIKNDIERAFEEIKVETHKNITSHIVISGRGLNNSNILLWFAKDTAFIEFSDNENKIFHGIYSEIDKLLLQRKSKLNFLNSKLIKYLFILLTILLIFLYSHNISRFYTILAFVLLVILYIMRKLWKDYCLSFANFLTINLSYNLALKIKKRLPLKKHCIIYLYDFKDKENFKNKYLERIIYLGIGAFIYFVFDLVKDLIKNIF